jgi:hypothetical protein
MPGYWFMYNMYALDRNAWKYRDRDRRTEKIQLIEYDYLAPDTINEMFTALDLLRKLEVRADGSAVVTGWENTNRETVIIKVPRAIALFEELIRYYFTTQLMKFAAASDHQNFEDLTSNLHTSLSRSGWLNIGGQLIPDTRVKELRAGIRNGKVQSWDEVHAFYREEGAAYANDKLQHAYCSLLELDGITARQFDQAYLSKLVAGAIATEEWMTKGIYEAREKDHTNPFRKMIYNNNEEMNQVLGRLEDNSFIQTRFRELDIFRQDAKKFLAVYCNA